MSITLTVKAQKWTKMKQDFTESVKGKSAPKLTVNSKQQPSYTIHSDLWKHLKNNTRKWLLTITVVHATKNEHHEKCFKVASLSDIFPHNIQASEVVSVAYDFVKL